MSPGKGWRGGATHCKNGHEFTPANTRMNKQRRGGPMRVCRTCANGRSRVQKRSRQHRRRQRAGP